jgi:hypothetical protein
MSIKYFTQTTIQFEIEIGRNWKKNITKAPVVRVYWIHFYIYCISS